MKSSCALSCNTPLVHDKLPVLPFNSYFTAPCLFANVIGDGTSTPAVDHGTFWLAVRLALSAALPRLR